jgi:hypothetical protein
MSARNKCLSKQHASVGRPRSSREKIETKEVLSTSLLYMATSWYSKRVEQERMNATIEVKEETARQLRSLAQHKGISVDDLLRAYVPGLLTNGSSDGRKGQADKIADFIEWAKSHPTNTPLLSEESYPS